MGEDKDLRDSDEYAVKVRTDSSEHSDIEVVEDDHEPATSDRADKEKVAMKESSIPKAVERAINEPVVAHDDKPNGGIFVLQWLTYAFWLWFCIAMSVLAGVVINYFVSHSDGYQWGGELAYPLSAVIVMLLFALIADMFYARFEPKIKRGGANVIMLLHVVPFILVSIGALVTVIFSLITMLLNSDPVADVDGPLKVMLVSLIVAGLFALLAARALFGGSKPMLRKLTWGIFSLVAIGFIIASIAGPAAKAMSTKQDRLVEQALPALASDIREYAQKNDKLPEALTDVTHTRNSDSSAVQKMIDEKLVTYKPNTVESTTGNTYTPGDEEDSSVRPYSAPDGQNTKRFYYQLCTKYTAEKKSQYNYTNDYTSGAQASTDLSAGVATKYRYDYMSSISQHPAGDVCYNLYADGKYVSTYGPLYNKD